MTQNDRVLELLEAEGLRGLTKNDVASLLDITPKNAQATLSALHKRKHLITRCGKRDGSILYVLNGIAKKIVPLKTSPLDVFDFCAAVLSISQSQRPIDEEYKATPEQDALQVASSMNLFIRNGRRFGYPDCCIRYFCVRNVELELGGYTCRRLVQSKKDGRVMCDACRKNEQPNYV